MEVFVMEEDNNLKLTFDPRTIEHLGIKMYSQLPYALAELIANAYDAGACNVSIQLLDSNQNNKSIVIVDDGDGMSYNEIKDNFLVIGKKRRDSDEKRTNSKGRRITGRKGLGKLALFGIGKTIEITTSKEGEAEETSFILDWDSILDEKTGIYHPVESKKAKEDTNTHGTTIKLTNLTRTTGFNAQDTAASLSKLFNCFDESFVVKLSHNNDEEINITRDLLYASLDKEFEWNIEKLVEDGEIESDYEYKKDLKGTIVSTEKPMKQNLRGITLYVNGRLANVPSFFGVSEAGHTFSYLTGWIDADFLDEFDKDLISTDRQSLSWDMDQAVELKAFLQLLMRYLVKSWSAQRKKAKDTKVTARSGIKVDDWYSKVPEQIRATLKEVVDSISSKSEIDDEEFSLVVKQVHDLVPPYTYFHYRLLHKEIQDSSREDYVNGNYYDAFEKAMKRYKNAVKDKAGLSNSNEDFDIVNRSFGNNKILEVTANFKNRPNGKAFSQKTLENIEEGQAHLSRGVVAGGRNVVAHEESQDLSKTGLFTEKDCLDFLSILSHLFKRLEESKKK